MEAIETSFEPPQLWPDDCSCSAEPETLVRDHWAVCSEELIGGQVAGRPSKHALAGYVSKVNLSALLHTHPELHHHNFSWSSLGVALLGWRPKLQS